MSVGPFIIIAIAGLGVLMMRFRKRWLAKINIAYEPDHWAKFAGWLPGFGILTHVVQRRTREIGIRLAIGARARDVLLQFLVEAVVLVFIVLLFEFRTFSAPVSIVASALLSTSGVMFALRVPTTTNNTGETQ